MTPFVIFPVRQDLSGFPLYCHRIVIQPTVILTYYKYTAFTWE